MSDKTDVTLVFSHKDVMRTMPIEVTFYKVHLGGHKDEFGIKVTGTVPADRREDVEAFIGACRPALPKRRAPQASKENEDG